MPREYRNVKQYEREILSLKAQGLTLKEIGERFGFNRKQIDNFLTRYNNNQRKLATGITLKRRGRPRKDDNNLPPSIQQDMMSDQITFKEYENPFAYID